MMCLTSVGISGRFPGPAPRWITKVQALQLTGNDPRSAHISAYAEPILRQEALSEQTAAIDGYKQSLQSALGKLGVKTP